MLTLENTKPAHSSPKNSRKKVKDNSPFKLDPAFIASYAGKKPKFGYNGLGEFVFYRTYSRLKDDGTKETFVDTLQRVVEGCYEIQRRWCSDEKNKDGIAFGGMALPWTRAKAQKSAQEMFQRMWDFKFLPPGRGLWVMGTTHMWKLGSAALNNCLAGSEEIITRDGIKRLADVVDTTQRLLTTNGEWVDAPIRSFGKQKLMKITVRRFRLRKTIYATPDHRWFARKAKNRVAVGVGASDRLRNIERKGSFREVFTKDLQPGFELQRAYGQGVQQIRPSQFGIAHGICFGDGTLGHHDVGTSSYIYLCGAKNQELLRYFSQSPTNFDPNKGKEGAMRVADIPRHFKSPPNLRECKSYLYGFLAGYLAADGSINKKACTAHIDSAKEKNMLMVREICAILGIGTSFIRAGEQTVNHRGEKKKFKSYRIYLNLEHLTVDFFLLEKHRKTYLEWKQRGGGHNDRFIVESVEETDREEEVFCATVPGKGCFTLADNILTGNCGFCSTRNINEDPAWPFAFVMDMSMLGVGVGFDTRGANKVTVIKPNDTETDWIIEDSREGWVDSLRALIESFTTRPELGNVRFNYSSIRPAGSPINGFGGKASGPDTLKDLHKMVTRLFHNIIRRKSQLITSVDIVDLMNFIGRCVVAGNVRRCLPKGTLVHAKRGLVPIEQIRLGELVLTSKGWHQVAENIRQGLQDLVTIKTQMGEYNCTAKHRVAVLTAIDTYVWKQAKNLKPGDRLAFVDTIIPGTNTELPGEIYRPKNITTCSNFVVPKLNTDVAWLIGALHGDGYTYSTRKKRGGSSSVMIPINRDEYHDDLVNKVIKSSLQFGVHYNDQPSKDNAHRLRAINKRFSKYVFDTIKRPKVPLIVPEFILQGRPEIRAAYVAGLLDTDGSVKSSGINLLTSVYYGFLQQIQAVYSSLGIPTKLVLRRKASGTWKAKYALQLVGDLALNKFRMLVEPHTIKKIKEHKHPGGYDFGYPACFIEKGVKLQRKWARNSKQMTVALARKLHIAKSNLVPVEVVGVFACEKQEETFDLCVPAVNEFVANGLLVHNSSEIALGDPADWDYMQMKDKTLFSEQLNSHRWASNNSIFATVGMDYRRVATQIADNGEPGCLWLDNVQNYGRTVDGRQEGIDKRAIGTNPCLTGNMRLLTSEGYARLEDIWMATGQQEYHSLGKNPLQIYGAMNIVNKNGVVPATNVYRTGTGVELFRVRFSDGSDIDATATHEFITLTRQRVQKKIRYDEQRTFLRDLKVGDMVPLNRAVHFGAYHDPAYAELAGWTIGDGSLSPKKDDQIRAQCTCYEDDIDVVLPKLRGLMLELYAAHNKSSNQSPAYAGWRRDQDHFDHEEETIGSNVLGRMLRADGVDTGAKHVIPNSIWRGTRETVAAFLRGFASADGYVQITDNGTISTRIWQANRELLLSCRLLLSQFGIASSVQFRRKAGWELIISGRKQTEAFLDQIGFIQPEKMAEARQWLVEHHGSNNSNTGRYVHVVSIEPIGRGDTYCLTEPVEHRIVVEGCEIGNCGEQSLEDAELCCLCETFPAHHSSAEDYHRTLKFAYLYAKTVTLLPTHCKKTNAVLLRNRRIGLSQSGIIQAFAKFGRRQVLENFCNDGYAVVKHWDEIYSEWLCVSKSVKHTSVKPSGSVSLLAGSTAGIHFTIAPVRTYWRNVRVANNSSLLLVLKDAGYHIEQCVTDSKTSVVRFGVSEPNIPSVSEISIWQQVKNAVDMQRYWSDNQVSCTVQFKPEEAKDIPYVLESFDDELKGISFLPYLDHGYPQAPYQPATVEEVAAYNARLKPLDFTKFINEDAVGSKFCDGDTCQV